MRHETRTSQHNSVEYETLTSRGPARTDSRSCWFRLDPALNAHTIHHFLIGIQMGEELQLMCSLFVYLISSLHASDQMSVSNFRNANDHKTQRWCLIGQACAWYYIRKSDVIQERLKHQGYDLVLHSNDACTQTVGSVDVDRLVERVVFIIVKHDLGKWMQFWSLTAKPQHQLHRRN